MSATVADERAPLAAPRGETIGRRRLPEDMCHTNGVTHDWCATTPRPMNVAAKVDGESVRSGV
jgi:hypothetical protein